MLRCVNRFIWMEPLSSIKWSKVQDGFGPFWTHLTGFAPCFYGLCFCSLPSCEVLVGAIWKHHNNHEAAPSELSGRYCVMLGHVSGSLCPWALLLKSVFVSGFLLLICVWVTTWRWQHWPVLLGSPAYRKFQFITLIIWNKMSFPCCFLKDLPEAPEVYLVWKTVVLQYCFELPVFYFNI